MNILNRKLLKIFVLNKGCPCSSCPHICTHGLLSPNVSEQKLLAIISAMYPIGKAFKPLKNGSFDSGRFMAIFVCDMCEIFRLREVFT